MMACTIKFGVYTFTNQQGKYDMPTGKWEGT